MHHQLAAPTALDRVIAAVSPRWGLQRLAARRAWAYEAARSSRLRGKASMMSAPEHLTAQYDRLGVMQQVRDLDENFGLWQGIIDKLALYAFGRVQYQQRTSSEDINKRYEDFLAEFFEHVELSGRFSLETLAQVTLKSELRDGDFAYKWRQHGDQLKVQGIESDRIGGLTTASVSDGYFQGITVDVETGIPMSYDVYRRTRGNAYVDKVVVPARDMVFIANPRRVDQYRGISIFAPICNEARDLKEVLVACLAGTKLENYHAAIGYTPSGRPLDNPSDLIDGDPRQNGVATKEQEIRPGMIQWAPSDAEYEFIRSDRPSGTFQTYVEMLVRLQGCALNLPYSFIYQMLGTGPAVRADLQLASRVVNGMRRRVTRSALDPVADMGIMWGIATGRIPFHPEFRKRRWLFSADVSIDAGRESQAKIAERNAGLRSSDSVFQENGEDARDEELVISAEVDRKLRAAKKLADQHGVSIDTVLTMLGVTTPNGFLFKTPDPQEADDAAKKEEAEGAAKEGERTDQEKQLQVRGILRLAR